MSELTPIAPVGTVEAAVELRVALVEGQVRISVAGTYVTLTAEQARDLMDVLGDATWGEGA